jgi:PIN domain nuclease of toxin-antitoxin system
MKVLLDTHAFLWYVLDAPQLSSAARAAIEGQAADVLVNPAQAALGPEAPEALVSPASYWEIAIKISLKKYTLTVPYETFWQHGIEDNDFHVLPIQIAHTAALLTMPFHHKDPFDRLLIAQAMAENLSVVSSDAAFDAYPIKRIW